MFAVIKLSSGFGIRSSTTGKNRGHVHALNRHGPVSAWMNSEWRHPEQGVARHAPRSIQRTADRLAFVM